VQKANSEAALWKQKCESGEGGVRSEELDELKKKFTARLMETESQLEAALSKAASMDKVNHRLRAELEDMSVEVERVRLSAAIYLCNIKIVHVVQKHKINEIKKYKKYTEIQSTMCAVQALICAQRHNCLANIYRQQVIISLVSL